MTVKRIVTRLYRLQALRRTVKIPAGDPCKLDTSDQANHDICASFRRTHAEQTQRTLKCPGKRQLSSQSCHVEPRVKTVGHNRSGDQRPRQFRAKHDGHELRLPILASAPFLNVVESVFSGMARTIIRRSDYHSKEAAPVAIDRYFEERNGHFRDNPKRVGKKIWGVERVPAEWREQQLQRPG